MRVRIDELPALLSGVHGEILDQLAAEFVLGWTITTWGAYDPEMAAESASYSGGDYAKEYCARSIYVDEVGHFQMDVTGEPFRQDGANHAFRPTLARDHAFDLLEALQVQLRSWTIDHDPVSGYFACTLCHSRSTVTVGDNHLPKAITVAALCMVAATNTDVTSITLADGQVLELDRPHPIRPPDPRLGVVPRGDIITGPPIFGPDGDLASETG
jgi:hypothetical protein